MLMLIRRERFIIYPSVFIAIIIDIGGTLLQTTEWPQTERGGGIRAKAAPFYINSTGNRIKNVDWQNGEYKIKNPCFPNFQMIRNSIYLPLLLQRIKKLLLYTVYLLIKVIHEEHFE